MYKAIGKHFSEGSSKDAIPYSTSGNSGVPYKVRPVYVHCIAFEETSLNQRGRERGRGLQGCTGLEGMGH